MTTTRLSWDTVTSRYRPGDVLAALSGSSQMIVVSIAGDELCVRQRLWTACLQRDQFETAIEILDRHGRLTAMELAERLRTQYLSGPQVVTECNRTPNLAAVVLRDLGATST